MDIKTFLFMYVLISFLFFLFALASYIQNKNLQEKLFLAANMLNFAGHTFLISRTVLHPFLSIFCANSIIIAGLMYVSATTLSYINTRTPKASYYILFALHTPVFFYLTLIDPNLAARVFIITIEILFIMVLTCYYILKSKVNSNFKRISLFLFSLVSLIFIIKLLLSFDIPFFFYKNTPANQFITAYQGFSTVFFTFSIMVWNIIIYLEKFRELNRQLNNKIEILKNSQKDLSLIHSLNNHVSNSQYMDSILDRISTLFNARFIILYCIQKENGVLRAVSSIGFDESFVASLRELSHDESITRQAITESRPVFRKTKEYPDGTIKETLQRHGFTSAASFPLITPVKTTGALTFCLKGNEYISEKDFELIELTCHHIATVLDNVTLYKNLTSSENNYKTIFEAAGDPIILSDKHGQILDANMLACSILRMQKREMKNKSILDIIHTTHKGQLISTSDNASSFEAEMMSADRQIPVWVKTSKIDYYNDSAHLHVIRDITDRKDFEEKLHYLATTDFLTGAKSRREFMKVFSHELKSCQRYKYPVSLIMLDIDDFKIINDTHGHVTGDEILIHLASLFISSLRDSDCFGRYGGEEFICYLPHTDISGACVLMERIMKKINFRNNTTDIIYTISAGITCIQLDDTSIDDIIRRADEALYRAKEKGKNRIEIQ